MMCKNLPKIIAVVAAAVSCLVSQSAAAGLKVAYSDWPGWVAWDIGVQKG